MGLGRGALARVTLALGLLLLPGVAWAQPKPPQWIPGSVIVNPTPNQTLLTSAPLPAGTYIVNVYVYSDLGLKTKLQQLDPTNQVKVEVLIPASAAFILVQAPLPLVVVAGDKLRIISRQSMTGEVQVVLFIQPQ